MRAPLWSYARFDWVRLQRLCTQFVARQVGRINPFQGQAGMQGDREGVLCSIGYFPRFGLAITARSDVYLACRTRCSRSSRAAGLTSPAGVAGEQEEQQVGAKCTAGVSFFGRC